MTDAPEKRESDVLKKFRSILNDEANTFHATDEWMCNCGKEFPSTDSWCVNCKYQHQHLSTWERVSNTVNTARRDLSDQEIESLEEYADCFRIQVAENIEKDITEWNKNTTASRAAEDHRRRVIRLLPEGNNCLTIVEADDDAVGDAAPHLLGDDESSSLAHACTTAGKEYRSLYGVALSKVWETLYPDANTAPDNEFSSLRCALTNLADHFQED